jgi:hypothetical protein
MSTKKITEHGFELVASTAHFTPHPPLAIDDMPFSKIFAYSLPAS